MRRSEALANEESLSNELFRKQRHDQCVETDRTFAVLMSVQWIAGIVMAMVISPRTWIGDTSTVHIHVWAAVLLGGLLSSLPIALALMCPGRVITRQTIAFSQMLWSALLIHLSGGRIETHFHVFGSLAFLAFYRDWKVIVTATLVVSVDHIVRGVAYPQSVFGVLAAGSFRWVEHAGWVVFEDIILIVSCVRGIRETREISRRRAQLELTNQRIESEVVNRTADLQSLNRQLSGEIADRRESEAREVQLGRIIEDSLNEIYVFDALTLQFRSVNRGARENLGYSLDDLKTMTPLDLKPAFDQESFRQHIQPLIDGTSNVLTFETQHRRSDGSLYPVSVNLQLSRRDIDTQFVAMVQDVTEHKRAEAELHKLQQEHLEASREAGKAEIATGVLHNVGNVLNSVNVSANLLSERLFTGRIDNLQKAVAMLEEHVDDPGEFLTSDEKGRRLPTYLRRLSESLSGDCDFMQTEVKSLSAQIDHIKEVVQLQQTHAKRGGHTEMIELSELVETALKVNEASLGKHRIEIRRQFDDVSPIETDKHRILEILVNLISNAKTAITQSDSKIRYLAIRINRNNDSQIQVEVQDSGDGVAPENLDRIFTHGFTTRSDGHGFGLHSSANAAAELGGALTVSSERPGHGATFTLRLPISKETSCLV